MLANDTTYQIRPRIYFPFKKRGDLALEDYNIYMHMNVWSEHLEF